MFTEAELAAVARDYERAGLTAAEVAMMAFAQQVVRDASAITAEDVEGLRRHGLDDAEILDVVLAAARAASSARRATAWAPSPTRSSRGSARPCVKSW